MIYKIEQLFQRCYNATVKGGLITEDTFNHEFMGKIFEEWNEFENELYYGNKLKSTKHEKLNEAIENELADIILVCTSFAIHHNIDIEKILKRKVIINENRND